MPSLRPLVLLLAAALPVAAQSTPNIVLVDDAAGPLPGDLKDTRRVAWVDYDFDGDLDLFALNYDEANDIYVNQGDGTFVADVDANDLRDASLAKGVAFFDMDGDGDDDAFVANGNDTANRVLLNQSDTPGQEGVFTEVANPGIETDLFHSYGVAGGDLDGDGNADAVVVNRYQANQLYFGNGDGTFSKTKLGADTSPISTDEGGSRDVALFDLDDDGDLDVVVVNSTDEDEFLYINLGGDQGGTEGTFVSIPTLTGGKSFGIDVADLDGDGLLDVLIANRDQPNAIFENISTPGVPGLAPLIGSVHDLDSDDSYDIVAADLEADGDMDVLVANRLRNNAFYVSLLADPFADPAGAWERLDTGANTSDRGNSRSVAVAPIADYADAVQGIPITDTLEVAFGNTGGEANVFYRNFGAAWVDLGSAHPGALGEPTLTGTDVLIPGGGFTLDVGNAQPGAPAALVAGLLLSAIPFKDGTLIASPIPGEGFLVLLPPTDGSGELAIPLVLPDIPGVTDPGRPVYMQGIVQDPTASVGFSITNGLRGTILED